MVNFDSQNPTSATIWPSNLAEAVNNSPTVCRLRFTVHDSRRKLNGPTERNILPMG